MIAPILISAFLTALTPQAPTASAQPQRGTVRTVSRTAVAPPSVGPRGTALPTGGTIGQAFGGAQIAPGVAPLRLVGRQEAGVYELVLNDTGTAWQESFLIGVPPVPAGPEAPLLVVFHGYGNTHRSILDQTSYFHEARARGWYIVAPLGAHKYNYAVPYAQQNVQAVLDWVTTHMPVDDARIYGVGFSMGGGNVTNYAARHLDPDHARFAAIVNHTGTVSLRDVYYNAVDPSLLEHVDMFGGSPADSPFEYARSSVIDVEPGRSAPDPGMDLARNIVDLPTRTFLAQGDPLQHLVLQTRSLSNWLSSLGGAPTADEIFDTVHAWDTMNEYDACEFLSQHTLDGSPLGTRSILADRDAGYYCFDVEQDAPGDFTPLRWNLDPALNRLVVDQTQNLKRLTVDTAAASLDTSIPLKVMLGTQDGLPEEIVLDGYDVAPTDVLRNGASAPLGSWLWDATTGTVTIYETDATAYPLWRIEP